MGEFIPEDSFLYQEQTKEDGEIPFDDRLETIKWCLSGGSFIEGDYIIIDRTREDEFFVHGVVLGNVFCDSDGEDFFCSDIDVLLDFMKKWGLLRLLTTRFGEEEK